MHVINNSSNEIRDGGVKTDVGGDEKQLIKFAWPNKCCKMNPIKVIDIDRSLDQVLYS